MTKKKGNAKYHEWLTDEGLHKVEGWAKDGLDEEQISYNMGISRKTLYNWKIKHLPILHALKVGKEVADRKVENALYNKALGYKETLNKVKVLNDGTLIPYQEEVTYPGDTTAMIFWLKNRKPKEWRDKQEITHDGGLNIKVEWTDED